MVSSFPCFLLSLERLRDFSNKFLSSIGGLLQFIDSTTGNQIALIVSHGNPLSPKLQGTLLGKLRKKPHEN